MDDKEYIMTEINSGDSIGIEIVTNNDIYEQLVSGGRNNLISNSLQKALDTVSNFMQNMNTKFKESGALNAEVEFGVNFDIGTGNILSPIISQSTEATMKIKLSWKNSDE